jgi:hypothetical protein
MTKNLVGCSLRDFYFLICHKCWTDLKSRWLRDRHHEIHMIDRNCDQTYVSLQCTSFDLSCKVWLHTQKFTAFLRQSFVSKIDGRKSIFHRNPSRPLFASHVWMPISARISTIYRDCLERNCSRLHVRTFTQVPQFVSLSEYHKSRNWLKAFPRSKSVTDSMYSRFRDISSRFE